MLNGKCKKAIADFAEAFRKEFRLSTPVTLTGLFRVVKDMGGEVSLGASEDTGIIKTGEESFSIVLPNGREDRRSFLLANAIGRLIFGYGFMIDKERWGKVPIQEAMK